MGEERAFGFACAFDLPEGVAAMADAGDVVEGSDVGEQRYFFFVQIRHAQRKIIDGNEHASTSASRNRYRLPHLLTQPRRA